MNRFVLNETSYHGYGAISAIADEMQVISFVGFISNAIGAIFFKLSAKEKTER